MKKHVTSAHQQGRKIFDETGGPRPLVAGKGKVEQDQGHQEGYKVDQPALEVPFTAALKVTAETTGTSVTCDMYGTSVTFAMSAMSAMSEIVMCEMSEIEVGATVTPNTTEQTKRTRKSQNPAV